VVRFGEKLRVVKEIAEETLEVVVPSMLLQPLIENSIKHGLEPRIGGGTVTLRSRILQDGRLWWRWKTTALEWRRSRRSFCRGGRTRLRGRRGEWEWHRDA